MTVITDITPQLRMLNRQGFVAFLLGNTSQGSLPHRLLLYREERLPG